MQLSPFALFLSILLHPAEQCFQPAYLFLTRLQVRILFKKLRILLCYQILLLFYLSTLFFQLPFLLFQSFLRFL